MTWIITIASRRDLSGASRKISDEMDAEALGFDIPEFQVQRQSDERWAVAEAMILECKAQTIVDLAWQLEAFLIADIEILDETGDGPHEWMHRTLLQNIRTLGAIPQPDDPRGSLSIDIGNDDELGGNVMTIVVDLVDMEDPIDNARGLGRALRMAIADVDDAYGKDGLRAIADKLIEEIEQIEWLWNKAFEDPKDGPPKRSKKTKPKLAVVKSA